MTDITNVWQRPILTLLLVKIGQAIRGITREGLRDYNRGCISQVFSFLESSQSLRRFKLLLDSLEPKGP
jgi:hypothetical protein